MFFGNPSEFMPGLDKWENIPLEKISRLYDRMSSLIIRNKSKLRDMLGFAQIWGALEFLRGLEYHHGNFLSHLDSLSKKDRLEDDSMLDDEAVAYLHRVRQFYYFSKSRKLLKTSPKIKKLYLFGRKIIGHRSIDEPWEEDSDAEQIWQAGCLQRRSFSGKVKSGFNPNEDFHKKMEISLSPKRYLNDEMFISYQILSNGKHATFTPQQDHPIILKEIEAVYTQLFAGESLPPRQEKKKKLNETTWPSPNTKVQI